MSLASVEARFRELSVQVGKQTLSALFPKEIEYYFLAMELVDSQNTTVEYFSFPILPEQLSETVNEITKVSKTIGGVSVITNTSFTPTQISLKGNFGRKFKVLLGRKNVEFAGFGFSIRDRKFIKPNFSVERPQFSSFAKTGYGCIKILESIKDKSKQLDSYQKPHSLYFYNPVLGNNYQVTIENFTHSQDIGRNMIPNYSLQLKSVASLDSVIGTGQAIKSALKNLAISSLQKQAGMLASTIRRAL